MHEMSIALSILDIAAEESERRDGAMVHVIYVRLGHLSGVVKEALLSAFHLARECSPFPQASLIIEDVPVKVFCQACQSEGTVPSMQQICCPQCGAAAVVIISGREMEITALEIEEPACADRPTALSNEV